MRGIVFLIGIIIACAAIATALTGCAVVQIHVADAGDVKTRVYPLGVKVEPQGGAAEGVYVEAGNLGVIRAPGVTSAGINDVRVYSVDPGVCALGIVGNPSPDTIAAARQAAHVCIPLKE
jgi:hypothetical protein